jgi:hypothetical protein
MSARPTEMAERWMRSFDEGGLEILLQRLRAEAEAAPETERLALTRALRYLHQVLLPEDAARALQLALLLDEPGAPRPAAASPRAAGLERERARLGERLAGYAAVEADLLAGADEHDRLLDEERALTAEVAELEALIAAEEARDE